MKEIIENAEIALLKAVVDTFGLLSGGIKLAREGGFTSGQMLDYIYKNEPSGQLGIGKLIDKIYLNHPEWRDIRTRKNNLVLNIKEAVKSTLEDKNEARICNIASGTADYIFDILQEYKNKNVTAEIRDLDIRWLLNAKETAKERNLEIEYKVANALEEADFNFDKNPDIIVVSGFYDWFDEKSVIKKSMSLIYNSLPKNGYFVFSIQAGSASSSITNKIFKDFNAHQLKMIIWNMEIINSILDELGFIVINTKTDENSHYPVLLTKKA